MATPLLIPAVLAGAVAVAIAVAPVAGADAADSLSASEAVADSAGQGSVRQGPKAVPAKPGRSVPNSATSDYSSSQIPQGWRNDALWARPGTPGSNPFGAGKRPPVIALD
jgi:hypothetical protein